jgi:hypothetical protein
MVDALNVNLWLFSPRLSFDTKPKFIEVTVHISVSGREVDRNRSTLVLIAIIKIKI